MTGSSAGETLIITRTPNGPFHHNRFGDPGFDSDIDFDSIAPGVQQLAESTDVINVNAGGGNDVIMFGLHVNLRGAIDGGDGIDTLDYSAYGANARVNLGISPLMLTAALRADQVPDSIPSTSVALGSATISNYDMGSRTFDISVGIGGLAPGDVTGFEIGQAPAGRFGSPVVNLLALGPLVPAGDGFTFAATGVTLPESAEAALVGDGAYLNIITAAFPNGAIRGQLFSTASNLSGTGAATGTASVAGFETVIGGAGHDSLVGNSAVNTITGGGGADWIVGGPGDETLDGGIGQDVFLWSDGDGSDVVEGGGDEDAVQVTGRHGFADQFVLAPNAGRLDLDRVSPGPFGLDIGSMEFVVVNGRGENDQFTFTALESVSTLSEVHLNGFEGNDTFAHTGSTGGSSLIHLNGGDGADLIDYSSQTGGVVVNLGLGTMGLAATLDAGQVEWPSDSAATGTAAVTNYVISPFGSSYDITVTVTGLFPADVTSLDLRLGAPGANERGLTNLGSLAPLVATADGFTFTATGVQFGGPFEPALLGGAAYVLVRTAALSNGAIRGQLFSLGHAILPVGKATGIRAVVGIENVATGSGFDGVIGSAGANTITSGDNEDWILPGPGSDPVTGGAGQDSVMWIEGDGSDVIDGGAGPDKVLVNGSRTAADALVVSASGTHLDVDPMNLDIAAVESLFVNGIGGNDQITVNDLTGATSLTAVSMNGFEGNDTLAVTRAAALGHAISVRAGTGADVLVYDAQSRPFSGDLSPPDGDIQSAGATPIAFTETETLSIANPEPTIAVNDPSSAHEGGPAALFTVSLSNSSLLTVSVDYDTANNTAAEPGDYTAQGGTLTFAPGETSKTVTVPIGVDTLIEGAETFFLTLSGAVNATIADAQGEVAITDNAPPTISVIADQALNWGSTGTGALPFTIGDQETPAASLTVSAASSNTTLVPNGNIVLGGSGASRTVTVTAVPNLPDTSTITITVADASNATASRSFALTVNSPTTVQPPAGLYVSAIAGNLVTFRFTPFPYGPQPTGFTLEGGVNPGEVLGSIPTGSNAPIFSYPVPTGSFYVRMHATRGTERSGPSNEIRIHVNVPVAPSAPDLFSSTVNGSSLALGWRNTFGGGAPAGVVLDVTGSLTAQLPVGLSESLSVPSAPPGTYTLRLQAMNAGGAGPFSSPVTVTIPSPCSGVPEPPSNFLGYRVGSTAFVVWDPPASGPAATSYTLSVTGSFVGNFTTTGRALSGQVGPGSYIVSVTAVNACGTSVPTATQTIVVP